MEAGKTYHIYTHANGSENLFQTDENFRYFLKRYEEYIPPVADTLAWCLMPNHLHLLVQIKSEKDLAKDLTGLAGGSKKDLSGLDNEKNLERLTILQFSHLFNAYTKAYNKFKKKRRGSLFTRAFKRQEITNDQYFTNIIHYIHHNPVHHGFVKHIQDWPWSSYHDFLLPNLTPAQQKVIDWFGNCEQFLLFHNQALGATPEITDHD
ncbi:MAG: transposase [Cytophagales bacterium]|nr:transposase [Cytophagales bacterium]